MEAVDPRADLTQLELRTKIAQSEFEWRDIESRRLADRAATLLTAGGIVLTVGGGLAAAARETQSKPLLWIALASFVALAIVMILALFPRPIPAGNAAEKDCETEADRRNNHLDHVLNRIKRLDRATRQKAWLVAAGGILLMAQVMALTVFLLVNV